MKVAFYVIGMNGQSQLPAASPYIINTKFTSYSYVVRKNYSGSIPLILCTESRGTFIYIIQTTVDERRYFPANYALV
uniref:Secreted protein n=1 Tax=Heterorhabditis bacteriophora TaxID=37862 RepID=A0A1I7X0R0_HETBA